MKFSFLGSGRRSVASDNAPSVALAVTTFDRLPAPPYQTTESAKPSKKPKIIPPTPVEVRVGREYDFITTGVMARVRVEKIWQENGETYVVISQLLKQNGQVGRLTHAIHISEFRQRVIDGGIPSITI